jgi:hypothetical protein
MVKGDPPTWPFFDIPNEDGVNAPGFLEKPCANCPHFRLGIRIALSSPILAAYE